jgi:membrane associated rhomboid family serine protease
MGDRDYLSKKMSLKAADKNALTMLIIANLVVFVLLNFTWIIYLVTLDKGESDVSFRNDILQWLTLPPQLSELVWRPWTILTYMFTHFSVWQTISHMLWLWAFGFIFQDLAGSNKIIPVYIYGGLVGAVFFVLTANIIPAASPEMIGGGASIMCLAIATTALAPGFRIFPMLNGGIPLWILTAIFVLIDISSASQNSAVSVAHIAAGGMGYLYVMLLKQGKDIVEWMNRFGAWIGDIFNPERKLKEEKSRLFYKAKKEPYVKKPNLTQQKLDDILDKINQKGYEQLTEEEKAFLKKASEQDI